MTIRRTGPVDRRARARRRVTLCIMMTALGACVSSAQPPAPRTAAIVPRTATPAARPVANPPARIPDYDPRNTPTPALTSIIQSLGRNFKGNVGIAVRRVDADWTVAWNGTSLFPQQSVSKLWVAMTLLDAADRKKLSLTDSVTVRREDMTLFHQPLASLIGAYGVGSLPEIADGDLPHTPRGCSAQAWSVAEALRVYHALAGERRRARRPPAARSAEAMARV